MKREVLDVINQYGKMSMHMPAKARILKKRFLKFANLDLVDIEYILRNVIRNNRNRSSFIHRITDDLSYFGCEFTKATKEESENECCESDRNPNSSKQIKRRASARIARAHKERPKPKPQRKLQRKKKKKKKRNHQHIQNGNESSPKTQRNIMDIPPPTSTPLPIKPETHDCAKCGETKPNESIFPCHKCRSWFCDNCCAFGQCCGYCCKYECESCDTTNFCGYCRATYCDNCDTKHHRQHLDRKQMEAYNLRMIQMQKQQQMIKEMEEYRERQRQQQEILQIQQQLKQRQAMLLMNNNNSNNAFAINNLEKEKMKAEENRLKMQVLFAIQRNSQFEQNLSKDDNNNNSSSDSLSLHLPKL